MMTIIDFANTIIWDWLIFLLLGTGIYLTIRTRFLQFRRFKQMFGVMLDSFKNPTGNISSFQAYCTSLASRVGTGNLAGVALAIAMGGPGAVFWMWLVAFLGMATSCVESSLAQLYKITEKDGTYRGGPAYYMERGLNKRWMGIIFSILLMICYGFVFNAVQSDSISNALWEAFQFKKTITVSADNSSSLLGDGNALFFKSIVGVILMVFTALIIYGGIKRISKFAELIVPFMAIGYILLALYVVVINIPQLPKVVMLVLRSAFGMREAMAGALAFTVSRALISGTQRGLFSNEAGMGSTPNAAATADVRHPVEQGFVQMLGVFTDTIVICTATAFIIIVSGKYTQDWHSEGIALTQAALNTQVGGWGTYFIAVAIFFFAFTSVVANYYYGENSLVFICDKHPFLLHVYRILVLIMVFLGTVGKSAVVWKFADLAMGLMATTNLIAIIMLSQLALKIIKDYDKQIDENKIPTFDPDKFLHIKHDLDDQAWSSDSESKSS